MEQPVVVGNPKPLCDDARDVLAWLNAGPATRSEHVAHGPRPVVASPTSRADCARPEQHAAPTREAVAR